MYRSNIIKMIQENKQVMAVKLAICYMYKTDGVHAAPSFIPSPGSDALIVKIYGIDKSGNEKLIAKCPLETTEDYKAYAQAASVIIGMTEEEFPWIYWTYDKSVATSFVRIVGQPELFVDVREFPETLDSNLMSNTTQLG